MAIETYEQATQFWTNRTNYEFIGLPTNSDEFTLDRINAVLKLLGNPHEKFRIIHVAGTKGKGSTSAMLESILRHAGLRTVLFTSPHLTKVEERVQVNRLPISELEFTQRMSQIQPAVEVVEREHNSLLTFFEIITTLAFLHFATVEVDVAVVEVGLGGRLDSTNVCTPMLSVISSISFDHIAQLGNTLTLIAGEKAGIIKPGVPVVCGALNPEVHETIARVASERTSPLTSLGIDFDYSYQPRSLIDGQLIKPKITVKTQAEQWRDIKISLFGKHQASNAALAISCVSALNRAGFLISNEAVRDGLSQTQWPARLEVLHEFPMVVLDCAHNVASIHAAVETITDTFTAARRGLIFACSIDKDIVGMLKALIPHFDHVWFTRSLSTRRGTNPDELAAIWRDLSGGSCEVIDNPVDVLKASRMWASEIDLVCALGSVYLAGEIRSAINDGFEFTTSAFEESTTR